MPLSWLRRALGINQHEQRLKNIESRLNDLESSAVRESDVELLRNEVEALRDAEGSPSKKEKMRSRILELVDRGFEKNIVKEKIVEDERLGSESYFYENWNYLENAGFLEDLENSEGFEVLIDPSEL